MKVKIALILMLSILLPQLSLADKLTDELISKGLKGDALNILNASCKEALNFDFKKNHAFWNVLLNKNEKIVSIDFLLGTKHYTLTLEPLSDGSCQTVRTITAYWTVDCKELASRYQKELPKGSLKLKEDQKIFMWFSTGKGTDIFLYKVPSGCVEIFKEFYVKGLPLSGK